MMLYIGSDKPLSIIPFNKQVPGFHTETLSDNDAKVAAHFSTEYVLYAGSSEGCGCGFQHALTDNGSWLNVVEEEEDPYRRNMSQLFEYVAGIITNGGRVELYACWDGEFADKPMSTELISYKELVDKDFYLKEKGFYTLH